MVSVLKCSRLKIVFINNSVNIETFLLPTEAHNVEKHRVIKTF